LGPFNKLSGDFIPLKNGVLWRGENILLPHSPVFGYTYCLPVKYNPDAECPRIDRFISEVVEGPNRRVLYEIPALCLLQNQEHHYAYMLLGSGSNGKSTYLKLLEAFLGEDNVSHVSLQDLNEDRFAASALVGKIANIYADIPPKALRVAEKFKVITGGDRLSVQKKFKDRFDIRITAKLIFSTNELPETEDTTDAFWRRWILIDFPNKFPPNPDLIKELTAEEELSGFLNKVLEAMTRIEVKGVTITDTIEERAKTWKKRANSIYGFVEDCLEPDEKSWELKEEVYQKYVEYCEINDFPARSKSVFFLELPRYIRFRKVRRKKGGERYFVLEGIRIKREYFEEESKSEKNITEKDWKLEDIL